MAAFDSTRLSVTRLDVAEGRDAEFFELARQFEDLIKTKGYGRAETVRDEGVARRFYSVRYWIEAAAAERCRADAAARAIEARICRIARVSHVLNGARTPGPLRLLRDDPRTRVERDRRAGLERRVDPVERSDGDRRLGPRRLREPTTSVDLVEAARRARESADAPFSKFKVGAALQAADGAVVTGCNIESATYGLTICAERVAMFKALSEGHRAFLRLAIVADTGAPTPPCGACRQVLWEFGGNLEIILANLVETKGKHELTDLLPLAFDARLF